ncbi:MAG: sugar transferase [Lachnospiraceae bacterium]|nr:sugar transferase [Lachnospiraceae bacterium]
MKVHITKIYNDASTAGMSQAKTAKIAKEMGFYEMGIYRYPVDSDNDKELGTRIDGIISALEPNDIVFIQSPSWNGLRYDYRFISKLRGYKNVKIAIFIHDVIPLMFNSGEENLRRTIDIYNQADLIIAPSQKMLDLLTEYGLTVKKQMIQHMWDYPIDYKLKQPSFSKNLFFTGAPSRFPFVHSWNYDTKLNVYTYESFSTDTINVELRGRKNELGLLSDLSEGGYGLVWSSDESTKQYYEMLQPYKVATFLSAGIPIIMQRGLTVEDTILKNGLGFVVDNLSEADAIVQSTTEEEYNEMVKRISDFNFLINEGWFTKKMLSDAIMMLLNNNI